MLLNTFKKFAKDEDGAVTVDWVVLTAAIVGLGLIVMTAIRPALQNLATDIGNELSDVSNQMSTAGNGGGNNGS